MRKQPRINMGDEEISDVQNDPVVQKLFEDAIEVLLLAGADGKVTVGHPSSGKHHQSTQQGREKNQFQQNSGKRSKKSAAITKAKRKKLERIKAPVTVFRKSKQLKVPSEEEQEIAVQKMLSYVNQMPSQETFQPPGLPSVSFGVDGMNVKYHDNAIPDIIDHFNLIFQHTTINSL